MSANNFYFAKEIDGKWYGWDEMAESWEEPGEPVQLRIQDAVQADSVYDLVEKLDDKGLGYSEYGLTLSPFLPKDGTPIEVVE